MSILLYILFLNIINGFIYSNCRNVRPSEIKLRLGVRDTSQNEGIVVDVLDIIRHGSYTGVYYYKAKIMFTSAFLKKYSYVAYR